MIEFVSSFDKKCFQLIRWSHFFHSCWPRNQSLDPWKRLLFVNHGYNKPYYQDKMLSNKRKTTTRTIADVVVYWNNKPYTTTKNNCSFFCTVATERARTSDCRRRSLVCRPPHQLATTSNWSPISWFCLSPLFHLVAVIAIAIKCKKISNYREQEKK